MLVQCIVIHGSMAKCHLFAICMHLQRIRIRFPACTLSSLHLDGSCHILCQNGVTKSKGCRSHKPHLASQKWYQGKGLWRGLPTFLQSHILSSQERLVSKDMTPTQAVLDLPLPCTGTQKLPWFNLHNFYSKGGSTLINYFQHLTIAPTSVMSSSFQSAIQHCKFMPTLFLVN
jgi:hypothetical protein